VSELGRRSPAGGCLPAADGTGIELVHEVSDPTPDLVSDQADLLEWLPGGIRELPVQVLPAGYDRALIAAPHRDDQVSLLGQLTGEELWPSVAQVEAELVHGLDHLRVNAFGRGGARGQDLVTALGSVLEQSLAHL
jgi:hypothetical protein